MSLRQWQFQNETETVIVILQAIGGWCIRFKRGLKTKYKENVVLVELDYPRRAPQTPEIKSKMKNCKWLFEQFNHYIANATTKEGKVNFEGIEVPVM
jgi:protein disulfide-isomerase